MGKIFLIGDRRAPLQRTRRTRPERHRHERFVYRLVNLLCQLVQYAEEGGQA